MRKILPLIAFLAVCGCQREVAVPTTQELIGNRELLTEWEAKCNTGEYSHLPADQKTKYCLTTQNASISVLESAAGKSAADFYKANTRRK